MPTTSAEYKIKTVGRQHIATGGDQEGRDAGGVTYNRAARGELFGGGRFMRLGIRRTFKILAPGNSLRKRVALSLAIARLILVPVIFLAVYYLFEMRWIVGPDRQCGCAGSAKGVD
jgi:hypothetical protein